MISTILPKLKSINQRDAQFNCYILKLKSGWITNSIKTLNEFIFIDRKIKQISLIKIFGYFPINREIWKLFTHKLFWQKLISGRIYFLKVTQEVPVDPRPKLNVRKGFIWRPERHVNVLKSTRRKLQQFKNASVT